jgi:hypothetical protein
MAALHDGVRVSVLATSFDVEGEERWSEAEFPDSWQTARVEGTLVSRDELGFNVRFSDADGLWRFRSEDLQAVPADAAGSERRQSLSTPPPRPRLNYAEQETGFTPTPSSAV